LNYTTRDSHIGDFAAILQLNSESVRFLSPLTLDSLSALHAQCSMHRVVELGSEVVGFLLALSPDANYSSVNYRWFCERYTNFIYIDRVVLSEDHQGKKLGQQLYVELFEFAKAYGCSYIAAEFDVDPPNEVSRRFHASFGFSEVGAQHLANSKKFVSMQLASLSA
jgi:uncharacterized protein